MPASLMIWLMDASLKGRWENSRVAAYNFSCFSAGRFKKVLLGTLFHPLLYEIEGPFSSAPPLILYLPPGGRSRGFRRMEKRNMTTCRLS